MEVSGGAVRGGVVDSHNDHRIAMACAVAALRAQGEVAIARPEAWLSLIPAFSKTWKL